MIWRLVLVAFLLGGVLVASYTLQRRRGPRRPGLAVGLSLITGAGCALCEPALLALRARAVEPRIVDVGNVPRSAGSIRSLPVAVVTDVSGATLLRRSGRAVISDADVIAEASRSVVIST